MAGGEVLANIVLSGDDDAARGFEKVGDAMEESSGSASIFGSRLSSLADELSDTIMPARMAASSYDEAGDEASQAGRQAAQAAAGFGTLSASTDGLRLSMGAISGNISAVITGIGGLMAAIAPLVPVLGLAAGAVLGLAGAFAAIIGTGILSFGKQRAKQNKQQLKQVKSKIKHLEELKKQNDGLSKSQQKKLANLKEQKKELKKGASVMGGFSSALKDVWEQLQPVIVSFGQQFVPLIQSALDALPGFVKSLLDAVGNLDPFVSALQDLGASAARILPDLLGMFVDLARQSLPMFREIGGFISANLVPALNELFQAGRTAAGPVMRLGVALYDLGVSLAPVAGMIGRVVLSLYDIAAGAVSAAASLTTSFIGAIRRGVGILKEWGSTIRSAVLPVLTALAGAWEGQGARIISVAKGMGEQIYESLGASALRPAVSSAQTLLSTLASLWQRHGATILSTINLLSRNLSEALISGMAAVSAAVQGDMLQMRGMIDQGATALLNIWRPLWRQFPTPVRKALTLAGNAVRKRIQQIRGAVSEARLVWQRHGGAVRSFASTAITQLQQFAAMARGAINRPLATFGKLRNRLNQMLPPFLQIRTTAKQLGTAISTTLLPALAASGLLGIATRLTPLLTGIASAFGGLRGVAMRVATLFSGPLVAGLRLLLGPLGSVGTILAGTLLPAVGSLVTTLGGPLVSVLAPLAALFNPITIAIGAVVGALALLGAASKKQLARFSQIVGNISTTVKNALRSAWNWVRGPGVKLAAVALGAVAKGAIRAFKFGKNQLLPAVRRGIRRAWNWAKSRGVQLGKQALSALGRLALRAFTFTRKQIVPKVRTALRSAWNWVRTRGVQLGKKALGALGRLALRGFKFGRNNLLPKIQRALRGAWNWAKGPGVQIAIRALKALGRLAVGAFNFGRNQLLPKIRGAIRGAWSWIKTKGLSLFKAAFRTIGRNLGPALVTYLNSVVTVWKTLLPRVRTWLRNNGLSIIKGGFKAIGRGIRTLILGIFGIAGMVGQAIVSTITGIGQWLRSGGATKLKNAFINIASGIVSYLRGPALGDLIGAIQFIVDGIMAAFEGLYQGLIGGSLIPRMFREMATFIRTFDLAAAAKKMLGFVTTAFGNFATDIIGGGSSIVKSLIGDISSYIRNGAKSDVVGAFEALGRGIEGAMESAAQWAVDGFNAIMPDSFGLPEVTIPRVSMQIDPIKIAGQTIYGGGSVGVGPFGPFGGQSFDVPQLAEGGIATGPTLGLFGEAGDEAILPLSKLDSMLSEAASGSARRSGSAGGGGTTINIDQTIERGAFQGVGLEEVRDLATTTFEEWMEQITRAQRRYGV